MTNADPGAKRDHKRLFKFWILGCAQFFSLHRHPLYRPVALLRASKVVCRWREKPSRSPADPKFKQSLRNTNFLLRGYLKSTRGFRRALTCPAPNHRRLAVASPRFRDNSLPVGASTPVYLWRSVGPLGQWAGLYRVGYPAHRPLACVPIVRSDAIVPTRLSGLRRKTGALPYRTYP